MTLLDKVKRKYSLASKTKDLLGGSYSSIAEEGEGFRVLEKYQSGKLYHGSTKPVEGFKVSKGGGRFGSGLYLTPDKSYAEFYSKGGRQGEAGQKLKSKSGHIYEFTFKAKTVVLIYDEDQFGRYFVSEDEDAEEIFRDHGDHMSGRITKLWGEFVKDRWGADAIIFNEGESTVLSPIDQIVVLTDGVAKQIEKKTNPSK